MFNQLLLKIIHHSKIFNRKKVKLMSQSQSDFLSQDMNQHLLSTIKSCTDNVANIIYENIDNLHLEELHQLELIIFLGNFGVGKSSTII